MKKNHSNESHGFDEHELLHELKHFLPAQAPLKDFVHHNTLHAFQDQKFYDAIRRASKIFGYKVSLSLEEYRSLYSNEQICHDILEQVFLLGLLFRNFVYKRSKFEQKGFDEKSFKRYFHQKQAEYI